MGFARKIKRANGHKEPRCCNVKMWSKPGYDKGNLHFYVCPECGKEKWIERTDCGAKMDGGKIDG